MSRRIAAGACALALLVPAAATAMPPPNDAPASHGGSPVAGDTKFDLHTTQTAASPRSSASLDAMPYAQLAAAYGINNKPKATPAYATAPVRGTESLDVGTMTDKQLAAAYGINNKPSPAYATAPVRGTESFDIGTMSDKQLAAAYGINNKPSAAPAHAAVASATDDSTDGWRFAAVVEAGLLAAFAVGAAVLLTGRQRRLRMGQ
jgi:hypothetical protein